MSCSSFPHRLQIPYRVCVVFLDRARGLDRWYDNRESVPILHDQTSFAGRSKSTDFYNPPFSWRLFVLIFRYVVLRLRSTQRSWPIHLWSYCNTQMHDCDRQSFLPAHYYPAGGLGSAITHLLPLIFFSYSRNKTETISFRISCFLTIYPGDTDS